MERGNVVKQRVVMIIFIMVMGLLGFAFYSVFIGFRSKYFLNSGYPVNFPLLLEKLEFQSPGLCNSTTEFNNLEYLRKDSIQVERLHLLYEQELEQLAVEIITRFKELQDYEQDQTDDVRVVVEYREKLSNCSKEINQEKVSINAIRKTNKDNEQTSNEGIEIKGQGIKDLKLNLDQAQKELNGKVGQQNAMIGEKDNLQKQIQAGFKSDPEQINREIVDSQSQIQQINDQINATNQTIKNCQSEILNNNQESIRIEAQLKSLKNQIDSARILERQLMAEYSPNIANKQIMEIFQDQEKALKKRLEIQKKLLQEKDVNQQELNKKTYQQTLQLYNNLNETIHTSLAKFKDNCKEGHCFFDKSIEIVTVADLTRILNEKDEIYSQIVSERARITTQQSLSEDKSKFHEKNLKSYLAKLSKLQSRIDELRTLLGQTTSEELINAKLKQIEEKWNPLQEEIDNLKKKQEDLQKQSHKLEQELRSLEDQLQSNKQSYEQEILKMEESLRTEIIKCIKIKKQYEQGNHNFDQIKDTIQKNKDFLKSALTDFSHKIQNQSNTVELKTNI